MINLDVVTIQDCLDLFYMKNKCTICNDGKIVEFVAEESEARNRKMNDRARQILATIV